MVWVLGNGAHTHSCSHYGIDGAVGNIALIQPVFHTEAGSARNNPDLRAGCVQIGFSHNNGGFLHGKRFFDRAVGLLRCRLAFQRFVPDPVRLFQPILHAYFPRCKVRGCGVHIGLHRAGLACEIKTGYDSSAAEGISDFIIEGSVCKIALFQQIDLAASAFDHQVLPFHGAEEMEDCKDCFPLRLILSGLFGHAEITPWQGNQIIRVCLVAGIKGHHADFMKVIRRICVFTLIEALCRLTFDGHKRCVVPVKLRCAYRRPHLPEGRRQDAVIKQLDQFFRGALHMADHTLVSPLIFVQP